MEVMLWHLAAVYYPNRKKLMLFLGKRSETCWEGVQGLRRRRLWFRISRKNDAREKYLKIRNY